MEIKKGNNLRLLDEFERAALQAMTETGTEVQDQIDQVRTAFIQRGGMNSPERMEAGMGGFGQVQASDAVAYCPFNEVEREQIQRSIDQIRRERTKQLEELARLIRDPEARERIGHIKQLMRRACSCEQAIDTIAVRYTPSTRSFHILEEAAVWLTENDPDCDLDYLGVMVGAKLGEGYFAV